VTATLDRSDSESEKDAFLIEEVYDRSTGMMKAADLQPGVLYRPTRSHPGMPNSYALVMDEAQVKRLTKRLKARDPWTMPCADVRILRAIEAGQVLIEIRHRRTDTKGVKQDTRASVFGLAPTADVKLRQVKAKPGYTVAVSV